MSNDYFMRQIEDMTRFLATVIFMKRPDQDSLVTEEGTVSAGSLLRYRLRQLLDEGNVNRAEDLLFETVNHEPLPEYLPVALDFYSGLNEWTDEQLEGRGFSRQEICEGLAEMKDIFSDWVEEA